MPMQLEVVTIEREVYSANDVDMVIAPGVEGVMGILPRHEPLITNLKEGVLEIVRGDLRDFLAIGGGFLEVHGTRVVVMADVAERADEIDTERAEAARRRAERVLVETPSGLDARKAIAAMHRAQVRLKVAQRRTAWRQRERG
jgi:F-type H+-transporting ATPase subunit epsilon